MALGALSPIGGAINGVLGVAGRGLDAAGVRQTETPKVSPGKDGKYYYFYGSAPTQLFPLNRANGEQATVGEDLNDAKNPIQFSAIAHKGQKLTGDASVRSNQDAATFAGNLALLALPGGGGKGALSKAAPAAPAMDTATIGALRLAQKDLQANPSALATNMARNPDLTFAEAAGQNAMTRVKALGNMKDVGVADDTAAQMAGRIAETPSRINRAAEATTGFAPEEGEGAVQGIVDRGQRAAAPLYEQAYGQQVDSPALREILSRPDVKTALTRGERTMRNAGLSPSGVKTELSIPESLPTGAPMGKADTYLADVKEMMGGGAAKAAKSDGMTLAQFVAKEGGIRDVGGDLRSMGAGERNQSTGFGALKKIVRNDGKGVHLDNMAERAWEAGYFKEVPSQRELLDAINHDLSGGKVRALDAGMAGESRAQYLEGLQQRINSLGVPSGADAKTMAKMTTRISTHCPRRRKVMQAVLRLSRHRLRCLVSSLWTMPSVPLMTGTSNCAGPARATRHALFWKPRTPCAMKSRCKTPPISRRWKRPVSTFRLRTLSTSRQFTNTKLTNNGYEEYVRSLTKPQKDANLQGILNEINIKIHSKEGAPNSLEFLVSPNARARMNIATMHLGPNVGTELLNEVKNAAEIRANARYMMPRAGSVTQPLLKAEAELARDVGLSDIPTSKGELAKAIKERIAGPLADMFQRFQMGQKAPVLKEYARLLLQRGDITVDEIAKLPQGSFKTWISGLARDANVKPVGVLSAFGSQASGGVLTGLPGPAPRASALAQDKKDKPKRPKSALEN